MSANKERSLYHGWVVVSYFLIGGGVTITMAGLGLAGLREKLFVYLSFGVGALIGGFFAGRLCPRKRFNEPATASVLLVLTIVAAATTTAFGPKLWDESTGEIALRSLSLAGASLVGALIGALLGHRLRAAPDAASQPWRWAGLSTLIGFGVFAFAMFVTFAVLARAAMQGDGDPNDGQVGILFGMMALGTAATGLIIQRLAPRRIPWTAGIGGVVAIAALGLIGALADDDNDGGGKLVIGLAIIGGVYWVVGYIGSRVGWWWQRRAAERVSVPDAHALSRS